MGRILKYKRLPHMNLEELYNGLVENKDTLAALKVLGLIVFAIMTRWLIHFILARLGDKHQRNNRYFAYLCKAMANPISLSVWLFVALYIFRVLGGFTEGGLGRLDPILVKTLKSLIVLALAWGTFRFLTLCKHDFMSHKHRTDGGYDDFSAAHTIEKICQIGVATVAFITVLAIFKIPLSGILTVGGVSGAALAFANQQLIANIFSGFAIFLDRPFSVGDWIYTSDMKIQGTVTNIGLRLTTIQGFDTRPIYVPNSTFNTSSMVNASRMKNRRILQYIGLRYQDLERVGVILQRIRAMLREHAEIDQNQLTLINLVDGITDMGSTSGGMYGSSSINFMVYTFTKTTNWAAFQNIQDDVMLQIGKIIREEGGDIAFTSYSLFLESVPPAMLDAMKGVPGSPAGPAGIS